MQINWLVLLPHSLHFNRYYTDNLELAPLSTFQAKRMSSSSFTVWDILQLTIFEL